MRKLKFYSLLLLMVTGCAEKPAQVPLQARVLNSNIIQFKGIDAGVLANLRTDTLASSEWKSLLPIYRMPADTDMKDFVAEQPGKYKLTDNGVTFVADTPLQNGQTYFARFYQFHDKSTKWDILRTKWKNRKAQYIECTFTVQTH